jgi:hypothetical protein
VGNRERILAALSEGEEPLCDDCISVLAGVRPRQTVFRICSQLSETNAIIREPQICSRCGRFKNASRASGSDPYPSARGVLSSPAPAPLATVEFAVDRPWHWEGHIQSRLAQHLPADDWAVRSAADTATKARGIHLMATKGSRCLTVEVKGYPTATFEHGPKRGQPKMTQPATQARQYFSHALLGMMLLRHKHPDAEIAACFPKFETFVSLARRTRASFELLGFGLYFVAQDGRVGLETPHLSRVLRG